MEHTIRGMYHHRDISFPYDRDYVDQKRKSAIVAGVSVASLVGGTIFSFLNSTAIIPKLVQGAGIVGLAASGIMSLVNTIKHKISLRKISDEQVRRMEEREEIMQRR